MRTSPKPGLKVFTSLDPRVQATGEQALNDELTRLDKQRKTKDGAKLEGAIVVTAPQSGEVIAVIGGRQLGFDGFNRALDARRSIGSLAKPMVYLAALETGRYNAATIVLDEPIEVKLARGKVWRPENFTPGDPRSGAADARTRRLAQSRDRARRTGCRRQADRRHVCPARTRAGSRPESVADSRWTRPWRRSKSRSSSTAWRTAGFAPL